MYSITRKSRTLTPSLKVERSGNHGGDGAVGHVACSIIAYIGLYQFRISETTRGPFLPDTYTAADRHPNTQRTRDA